MRRGSDSMERFAQHSSKGCGYLINIETELERKVLIRQCVNMLYVIVETVLLGRQKSWLWLTKPVHHTASSA